MDTGTRPPPVATPEGLASLECGGAFFFIGAVILMYHGKTIPAYLMATQAPLFCGLWRYLKVEAVIIPEIEQIRRERGEGGSEEQLNAADRRAVLTGLRLSCASGFSIAFLLYCNNYQIHACAMGIETIQLFMFWCYLKREDRLLLEGERGGSEEEQALAP